VLPWLSSPERRSGSSLGRTHHFEVKNSERLRRRRKSSGLVGGSGGRKNVPADTEKFAEIVIRKVWAREGKKISTWQKRLSISPKKVLRILRSAGLLE
jgi:hypothetical protein